MISKQIRTGLLLLSALLGLAAMDAAATDVTVDQGQTLFGSEIQTITINPATGDITIKTKSGNWGLSQSGTTNPDPDPNGQAPTVDLKVDNQTSVTVTEGTSVRLSWSINDADSCQTTKNGVSVWDSQTINLFAGSANGQADITVDFTATKSFRLSCSNKDGTTSGTVNVTGQAVGNPDTPTPDSCPNVGQVDIVNWTSISGGGDFPSMYGTRSVTMEGSTPMAIRFDTLTAGSKTYGGFAVVPSTDTYAPREIAVSTCPGVFDVPKRCAKYNIGTLHWELDLDKGYFHTCKLDQGTTGQTYYLNVRFPDGCEDRFCTAKIGTE